MLLTMKNIVKVANPLGCELSRGHSSSPAPAPARKSPLTKRKTVAGCPFELGVRAFVDGSIWFQIWGGRLIKIISSRIV
ncbi:hypothetical protein J2Z66_005621 [Paenibacillus eucommiae]|uniref:Uncharacterized protein n=1 Tax=Paenibacillus eucommiae TaxID=1355755 RepID=A0ABS4J2D8_9BACL|nr:hypothetical protein [Paenibacillus eucommiae]